MKKGRMLCCFSLVWCLLCKYPNWVSPHQHDQIPHVVLNPEQGVGESIKRKYRVLARLGSGPPNWEHKCGGCCRSNACHLK